MKLDKIKFARLVHFIGLRLGINYMNEEFVTELDAMIDIELPEQQTVILRPCNADVEQLMALMASGTEKIEAIKCYRSITGMGLKESKDAVERYWPANNTKEMLDKLDQQIRAVSDMGYTLKGFSDDQLIKVKDFIESFRD